MLTQRNLFSMLCTLVATSTFFLSVAARGDALPEPERPQQRASSTVGTLIIPNFKGLSDSEICKIRTEVEEQQAGLRELLLEQLEDETLSPVGRAETISLFSSFPPNPTVIGALIRNLDVVIFRRPDDPSFGPERFIGYIARHVLAGFGAPAQEQILTIIGEEQPAAEKLKNDADLRAYSFGPSKVDGFADVLTRIESKEGAISVLQEAQTKANNPKVKAQFQAVIETVKKGTKSPIKY
jgi:hypothetical protein